ncbi:predicted protein [Vibrio cholerae RC385]|nr:predicted protein [Vibrio cholerae RC385]
MLAQIPTKSLRIGLFFYSKMNVLFNKTATIFKWCLLYAYLLIWLRLKSNARD